MSYISIAITIGILSMIIIAMLSSRTLSRRLEELLGGNNSKEQLPLYYEENYKIGSNDDTFFFVSEQGDENR